MIKILYKECLYKEIDNQEIMMYIKKQQVISNYLGMVIGLVNELLKIDISSYLFGKEFIQEDGDVIIILRNDDYIYIRDVKLNNLLKN